MQLSEKVVASLNKVIEKFKSGDLSPITSLARFEIPEDAPCFKWSFSNKVLAYIQAGELDADASTSGNKQVERSRKAVKQSLY